MNGWCKNCDAMEVEIVRTEIFSDGDFWSWCQKCEEDESGQYEIEGEEK